MDRRDLVRRQVLIIYSLEGKSQRGQLHGAQLELLAQLAPGQFLIADLVVPAMYHDGFI